MAGHRKASPRVASLSWGRVEVEGVGTFKDAKLFPGGARAWDWRETGTHHVPGILPADVEELVTRGATTIVLSQGMWRRLQVSPDTLQWLKDKGIPAHILPSDKAVALYNELREGEAVGALVHSTC